MTFSEMKNLDPRTIDPDTLADIADVHINTSLPPAERLADYLAQIKNPYCFRCGGVIVRISYTDTDVTFEDAMELYIRQRQIAEHNRI